MRLRTIEKADVKNKRVLVRADFNVAMEKGAVKDDFRILRVVPTVRALLQKKAKVILISHLGRPLDRPPSQRGMAGLSLRNIALRLAKDLRHKVRFVPSCVGPKAERAARALKAGEVLLLENLRFHKGEEENDDAFASGLAALGDIYVNEAFSVSHRNHASVVAITRFLPSYAGPQLAEEARVLHQAYAKPKLPLVMVMGGAKVETKARLIKRFFEKATNILLGGIIANAVLQIQGAAVGKSTLDPLAAESLKGLDWTSTKLHAPVDVVVAKEISASAWVKTVGVGNVNEDEIILDIGLDTVHLFSDIAASARTLIWNGPLGFSELPPFAIGSIEFAKAVAASKAFTIVGGGETVTVIDKLGLADSINFISTGGGAMLEFLAGDSLPGIEALRHTQWKS